MRYLSVCSGIEAATVAWKPLGWKAAAFSEIEKFPRELLQHHYPEVPLHGDFTTIGEKDYGTIDLLVGGTPCQSFSVAGLRKGFNDHRGNLTLAFLQLLKRKTPKWVVWENVPGVLSHDRGRTFATFLRGLGECGYGFAYRVLDAQYFGVPQERRRVFVVGYLGDWRNPAKVLFEPESLQGDITPSQQEREDFTDQTMGSLARSKQIAGTILANCGEKQWLGNQEAFTGKYFITYGISGNIINKDAAQGGNGMGVKNNISYTLTRSDRHCVAYNKIIRKFTPMECERLMGFPDNYTRISDNTADGPRYKAVGNSMAVPKMRWIGQRINLNNI